MSDTQPLPLSIWPVISYPRQAKVGEMYMMTIDLETPGGEWLYEEEEYTIDLMLDTLPLFTYQAMGESSLVLHRFGGTYGAAKFLLTAAQEEMQGKIRVTLVNKWGVPIRVLSLDQISITQGTTDSLVPIGSYERVTSVPQREVSNSSIINTRNPYIVGTRINTPEKLFGRELIFRNIEESLKRNAKFILLHGQRRIGKSSILKNIPFLISQNDFLFVTCDLQVHGNSNLGEILSAIARTIVEHLNLEDSDSILHSLLNADSENIRSIFNLIFLPLVYEVLDNKKLVLLLDDFDVVTQKDTEQAFQFVRFLEDLLREQEDLFLIAVVSRTLSAMPNLVQLFRDVPVIETVIEIGGLDKESVKRFITETSADYLKYEPKAIQAITNLSAGHPYFLQILCFAIFTRARELEKWTVTEEDVEMIVDKAIELAEGGLAWYWEALSIPERVIFSAVAEAQKQNISENPLKLLEDYGFVITDALEEAIQLLINKDFLNINPIKIKVELIRLWLLQRHPLRDEIWQLDALSNSDIDSLEPPEPFVERASEIAAAFEQILYRSHLAIWGGRGMGKTSFLQKLESPQAWEDHGMDSSEAVIVRFSCEKIVPFIPTGFWKKVLSLLKENLHAEPELQANIATLLAKARLSKDSLRQVLRKLVQREKFLVLLVDDFHIALETKPEYDEDAMQRFLSDCRNLAVHSAEGQHICMIVTSLKRLNELGPKLNPNASPWYNHYLFLRLKTFNNTEIDQFLQSSNKLITPELREAIKEITGGNPNLLKIASSLIESPNSLDPQEFANELESSTRKFLVSLWDSCSQVEQTLLMLLALYGLRSHLHHKVRFDFSGIGMIFTQREGELIKLEEQGVLTHIVNQEKNIYSFSSSIMEFWVIQELQQIDENWLQARKKVFLNLMSHQQMDKFTTAIKWVWNNQDKIPPIMEWFRKLLAAFPRKII